jgi:FAD/FMN-containing dehydrogenase
MNDEAITTFGQSLRGALIGRNHPEYDEARKLYNAMIDKRPLLIARCADVADVISAVNFGRDQKLPIAIRGGGHNGPGHGSVDDGLVVDLSMMKGVRVDPASRTVRVGPGCTSGDVDHATHPFGLAVPFGIISTTGVAGLTLGGGSGHLTRKFGLTIDNLIEADVVLADGSFVTASKTASADLFWALRGGGGNFGVVTSFAFRLHPVGPIIYGGLAAHPFDKARDVLRYFRDMTQSLPDEVVAFGGLVHAPDGSGMKLAALVVGHFGDLAAGEKAMKPVKAFGPPVMDAVGPIPYNALNSMLDAGYPKGALNYWKSSFLSELSDASIDTLVACFAKCPTPMGAILIEHFHGEACRVPVDATAFPHRGIGYNMAILSEWMDPAATKACTAWARETYDAMKPFRSTARYVNYMGDDEAPDQVAAAYGPNYPRLQKIKAKYDPGNVFHLNQNILPSR